MGTLKRMVGVLLGLACVLCGWIVFSANGFYVPILYLAGTIMIPLGILVLGTSLIGGLDESGGSLTTRPVSQEEELDRDGRYG